KKTGRFYLVVASLADIKEAREETRILAGKGYPQAKIIENEGKFRISAVDFSTKEEAQQAKNRLKTEYTDVWIMAF
ncbi:MAG: SPOR domain-containing protein, partial [Bacteroidales bacterium]|nr:SPOR domain-containing protein [Bacteroidales bacterium]